MAQPGQPANQVRFGEFQLDLQTGELRNNGHKVTLPDHPFHVLVVLLEHPGRLVTREELKKKLWTSHTFVDFDQGLNKAVNRLREALGDAAESPRFIETLPRKGYRFVGTLERVPPITENAGTTTKDAAIAPSAIPGNETNRYTRYFPATSKLSLAAAALLFLAPLLLITGFFLFRFRPPEKGHFVQQDLTANPSDNPVVRAVISPDGKELAYDDRLNGLSLLQVDTGEKRSFPDTSSLEPEDWFPDGAHLLISGVGSGGAWKMSTLDGSRKKILDDSINFQSAVVSHDGTQIAFNPESNPSEIWIVGSDGENPHRILSIQPSLTFSLAWSPTSRRILYPRVTVRNDGLLDVALESCNRDGHDVVTILSHLQGLYGYEGGQDAPGGLSWAPDGRVFYTPIESAPNQSYSNIWSIAVDPDTGRALGKPLQETHWARFWAFGFSHSADGRRFAFLNLHTTTNPRIAEVVRAGKLASSGPLVDDSWDTFVTGWTTDSRTVLFESNPQGRWGIFKQDVQTHETQPILSGPDSYENAVVSSDGQWLLFTQYSYNDRPEGSGRLMRMRVTGGSPTLVLRGRVSYQCASQTNLCVVSEVTGNRRVFSILDPIQGRGTELAHQEPSTGEYRWSLSPNGKRIAFVPVYDGHNGNHIQILDLATGNNTDEIELKVEDLTNARVQSVAWAPDNQHLYVSYWTGASFAISWTGPDGQLRKLVETLGGQNFMFAPKPSPDGHYLAYLLRNYHTNVTMLENY